MNSEFLEKKKEVNRLHTIITMLLEVINKSIWYEHRKSIVYNVHIENGMNKTLLFFIRLCEMKPEQKEQKLN